MSEKTEEATPTRLRKAREDGDAGVSGVASQAVAFLVGVALLPAAGGAIASRLEALVRLSIARAAVTGDRVVFDGAAFASELLLLVLPFLGAVGLTSGVVSTVQAGGVFSTKKLALDLTRLDPISGLGKLFSLDRVISLSRSLVGTAFVAWLVWDVLHGHAADLSRSAGSLPTAVALATREALVVLRDAAIVGLGMAVIDVVVTRRSWMKRLRMGKEEVKREHKESDGDPQMKAARERARHELLASATIANVKGATVVIVNPTHLACALRYDDKDGDTAPVVVATGRGDMATRIIEAAHAYGIPVLTDVPLARALVELEVGDVIPEALYEAVAEILQLAWEDTRPKASQT
jgi:flagellar biosynthesis protein FlhB